jgi:hypothetical protein
MFLTFHFGFHLCGQENFNFEVEKLRFELRHVQGMYALARSETMDASLKVNVGFILLNKTSF